MRDEDKIRNRLQSDYNLLIEKGYEVVGVFLQGSQNYNLDYEESDIDTKAIVLPSFRDFLFNSNPTSTTIILETEEHIDVKDIRVMFLNYKKQNINFIETLFTKYKLINPKYKDLFNPMLENNEKIARYDQVRAVTAMYGMACEKKKALKHPYPTTAHKIEKFGYDPKQLHHIIRLEDFQRRYFYGYDYVSCLTYGESGAVSMIDIKKGTVFNLDEVDEVANTRIEIMKERIELIKKTRDYRIDEEADQILESVMMNIFTLRFKEELMS
jgi:predicted nucleotidyltransferase